MMHIIYISCLLAKDNSIFGNLVKLIHCMNMFFVITILRGRVYIVVKNIPIYCYISLQDARRTGNNVLRRYTVIIRYIIV